EAGYGNSGVSFKFMLDRGDFRKRRQSCLIAEMLNLESGRGLRKFEMFLPALRRIGEIGINVSAVENVSGSTGIENSIRWHGKSRKSPDCTSFVVPDDTSLSERHSTNPTTPALEIVKHRRWLMPHLFAQALGHNRHVDEAQE